MNIWRTVRNWLHHEPHHLTGVRILQVVIGATLLFRLFTEAPFHSYLWGPNSIATGTTKPLLGPSMGAVVDRIFLTDIGTLSVLMVIGIGAFCLMLGWATRIATIVTMLAFHLLQNRLPLLGDGGDNITQIVLIYMCFLLPAGRPFRRGSVGVWMHNVAVVAIISQLMVLYATSGMMKAFGSMWHHGTAIYYISQVEWFSHPGVRDLFKSPLITTVSTYTAMLYQVLFPVAIFSRVKIPWLVLGIAFHLGIAVLMGLITFSSMMIALELFLITDREWEDLLRPVREAKLRLRAVAERRRVLNAVNALAPTPKGVSAKTTVTAEQAILSTVPYQLFIDGYCPHCRAAGRIIQRLDILGRIEVVSFRHSEAWRAYNIPSEALEKRMHIARRSTGEVASGFGAVRALANVLPLLAPVRPLLALGAALGLGDRIYDLLASRRTIIPDARACSISGGAACAVGDPMAGTANTMQ